MYRVLTAASCLAVMLMSSNCLDLNGQPGPVPRKDRSAGSHVYSSILGEQAATPILWGCQSNHPGESSTHPNADSRYQIAVAAPVDLQAAARELDALGFTIDLSIYDDLPPEVSAADVPRLIEAAKAVASLNGSSPQAVRTTYQIATRPPQTARPANPAHDTQQVGNDQAYPMGLTESEASGQEPLPLVFAPDPVALRTILNKKAATGAVPSLHGLSLDSPMDAFIDAGLHYGYNIVFSPATRNAYAALETAATGMPEQGATPGIQYSGQPNYHEYAAVPALGKAVVQRKGLGIVVGELNVGQPDGPELLGVIASVQLADRVFLAEIVRPGQPRCRVLAFPVLDANGGARLDRPVVDERYGGRFENSFTSDLAYDERIGRYSALRVPFPRPIGEYGHGHRVYPQERFVVNDDLANLRPPLVVFRKAETWRPFMPDYVLDNRLSFFGKDADTAELVVIFANADIETLVRVLGALRNIDVSPLLGDANLMHQLKAM